MKYKVGDCVKVVKRGRSAASHKYYHKVGIITTLYRNNEICSLDIETEKWPGGFWCDELELARFKTQTEKLRFEGKL